MVGLGFLVRPGSGGKGLIIAHGDTFGIRCHSSCFKDVLGLE